MRAELAEATESLAMAKSLFARAAQANDLEEQLKARYTTNCCSRPLQSPWPPSTQSIEELRRPSNFAPEDFL